MRKEEIKMEDWEPKFWDKVNKNGSKDYPDCWIWTAAYRRNGYGEINIDGKIHAAHRLSWELANNQKIPKGMCILHTCDYPPCVRSDHLWMGTRGDNTRDMAKKGRHRLMLHPELRAKLQGENASNHKLTEKEVLAIREEFSHGKITKMALSKKYGVRDAIIGKIIKRQAWKHI